MEIKFYTPTITEDDIQAVTEVLRSGWITTGAVNEQFSESLKHYLKIRSVFLMNSATAGLFVALKAMGIGKGDEVITTPYTFAATANVIVQTGAKVVFADVKKDSFYIDLNDVYKKITKNTKAVIPVDYSTAMNLKWDWDQLGRDFEANNPFQEKLNRPMILADSAHALGSRFLDESVDMASYSFHAVKNLTTAEGGALAVKSFGDEELDQQFEKTIRMMSLHGQDKSARDKFVSGSWEYDIAMVGYKFNLPDLTAALGFSQFKRYESIILPKRRELFRYYYDLLKGNENFIVEEKEIYEQIDTSSCHLFPIRIKNFNELKRNHLIQFLAEEGVSANVHYKPLTEMSANRIYGGERLVHSYAQYENMLSLPFHLNLTEEEIIYVVEKLKQGVQCEIGC